jgi:triosephosphate isomerase
MGAEYIILGHSENRSEGETAQLIKKKIISALNQKLNIIFCIGETYKDKERGRTFSVIRTQIKSSLEKKFNKNKIILAYEPVWSIGTNKIPNIKDLQTVIKFIKNDFKKIFKTRKSPRVLYGGSVNSKNIKSLSAVAEIDGFLIGGASQSAKKFIDIIKKYYK